MRRRKVDSGVFRMARRYACPHRDAWISGRDSKRLHRILGRLVCLCCEIAAKYPSDGGTLAGPTTLFTDRFARVYVEKTRRGPRINIREFVDVSRNAGEADASGAAAISSRRTGNENDSGAWAREASNTVRRSNFSSYLKEMRRKYG